MNKPLAVDLDGTLINTDLFFESAVWYIRKNPLRFFQMCWWFFTKGRVELKIQIEKRADLSVSNLPFNQKVIQWLREEKKKGRELVLVTGASQKYAEQVAEHLNLFSQVFGVCWQRPRLTGKNKARFLVKRYGEKHFDYVGNSIIDLAVWRKAGKCITANAFPFVIQKVQQKFSQVQVISESFSIKENWNLFKKFFSIFLLRIAISMTSVFFVLFADGFVNWSDWIFDFFLILPAVILFHIPAFLLGELKDLGPNRVLQRNGIFTFIFPYWSLLSIPLFVFALFYIFIARDLLSFSVWWFLVYFILEYMRWTYKKYSFYYDWVLTSLLWFFGFSVFL